MTSAQSPKPEAYDERRLRQPRDRRYGAGASAGGVPGGLRTSCFLSPRDIPPGAVWDEAIVDGIDGCAGMVVVHSAGASESSFVKNEVNCAFSNRKTIFTFRLYVPRRKLHAWSI